MRKPTTHFPYVALITLLFISISAAKAASLPQAPEGTLPNSVTPVAAIDTTVVATSTNPLLETPAGKAFINLSMEALELLDRSTRLDMLDYRFYYPDKPYKARNTMRGESELIALTPDYLKVRLTRVSEFELRILPCKDDPAGYIIATSYTVGDDTSAPDSSLIFYTSSLQEIERKKVFREPKVKDFFYIPKGSTTKMKELEDMVPFPTTVYQLNADDTDLKARLTVGTYINQDDYNILKLFLLPSISYKWNGKKYELIPDHK